jgi:hypothetical protein
MLGEFGFTRAIEVIESGAATRHGHQQGLPLPRTSGPLPWAESTSVATKRTPGARQAAVGSE